MDNYDVLIVGAGPAGTTCAAALRSAGLRIAVLDRAQFPREKLCAGWLTPRVFDLLGIPPSGYPGSLTRFPHLNVAAWGFPFRVGGPQYAIRRYEFDAWLVRISGIAPLLHEARVIERHDQKWIVDGRFVAPIIVGAGGSYCPVYRQIFRTAYPRRPASAIVAIEEEFSYSGGDAHCRLRFFDDHLPGYAWFVPKRDGIVNVGIGGVVDGLKGRGHTITAHWESFIKYLERKKLVTHRRWNPSGYVYHTRQTWGPEPAPTRGAGDAFLVGDAVGLATLDMGEGIAAAIESGKIVADAILTGREYNFSAIPRYSLLPRPLRWVFRRHETNSAPTSS